MGKGRPFIKYCISALVVAGVLMLLSGRPGWIRGWALVGLTFGLQVAVGVVLTRTSPELLVERSRMQKGTKKWDKILAPVVALGPLVVFGMAAWDVRFQWPPAVPIAWSLAALAVCCLGGALTAWAMAANRFFSGTVRIQSERGHSVVDGGPYRYLRHPGYTGALAFTLAAPVALGSWRALIPAAVVAAVLVIRTALEDRTLRIELAGYAEYAARVRKRLVPAVW